MNPDAARLVARLAAADAPGTTGPDPGRHRCGLCRDPVVTPGKQVGPPTEGGASGAVAVRLGPRGSSPSRSPSRDDRTDDGRPHRRTGVRRPPMAGSGAKRPDDASGPVAPDAWLCPDCYHHALVEVGLSPLSVFKFGHRRTVTLPLPPVAGDDGAEEGRPAGDGPGRGREDRAGYRAPGDG